MVSALQATLLLLLVHCFLQFPGCRQVTAFAPIHQHQHRHRHAHPLQRPTQTTSSTLVKTRARTARHVLPVETLSSSSEFLTAASGGLESLLTIDSETAEALGGPLFGFSLFPYLAFLYFLSREETKCPKGVTVGFAILLLFVFLTIPAAITAKLQYGASLADSDWLHGSAESLLTITNLVTVVAFRQALNAKEQQLEESEMPPSVVRYGPMLGLSVPLFLLAGVTALVPALSGAEVHTPYLNGFMDLPHDIVATTFGANPEPDNALTVAT